MSIEEIKVKHGNNYRVLKLVRHKESYVCEGCKEEGSGLGYQCKQQILAGYQRKQQIFAYHKICAWPREAIQHTFFPNDAVQFVWEDKERPQRHCYACGNIVKGFHYRVINENRSEIYCLHPSCATLPRVRRVKEVDLILEKKASSKCLWCGSTSCEKHHTSWCYEYGEKWCLHLACVREMIEKSRSDANVSSRQTDYSIEKDSSSKSKVNWEIVEQGLKFIVAFLFGDVTGAISGTIVYCIMRLLLGKT